MMQATGQRRVISVPWPIRLFGDLQDSLDLPSVTAGLDLRTGVSAVRREDNAFCISGGGLAEPLVVEADGGTDFASLVPSFVKGLCAATAKKLDLTHGYDVEIHSRVPGLADLRDCPVATVTWLVTLLALGGALEGLSGEEVAEMAIGVMAEETPRRWGAPEVYACVLGGVLVREWRGKAFVEPVERSLPGLVAGYCCGRDRAGATGDDAGAGAVERLLAGRGKASFAEASFEEVVGRLRGAAEADARVCYAHLMIREHCRTARALLDRPDEIDDDRLGEALDGTHEMLRDYLGRKAEEVERLIDAAKGAGALGCKLIPGTGMFVAFAPNLEEQVVAAVRKAGGEARRAEVSDGMRVEVK